jgi:hypothetical protein
MSNEGVFERHNRRGGGDVGSGGIGFGIPVLLGKRPENL